VPPLVCNMFTIDRLQSSQDGSVGIVTGYELDGEILIPDTVSRPFLGLTQSPIEWVLGDLSPGVKWPGSHLNQTPRTMTFTLPYIFMAWCLIN
jgi:hypothetical protein